jgi:DNA-binding MarR family transcriptional regulator
MADKKLPPLLNRISFMMHRINAHMMRICNPYFQEWGVDLVTSRMMVALLEKGPLSAGEIVRIMALPQSTISHQIKRLEKLGYLSRAAGEVDSRVVITELTERGREVAVAANALSRRVTDELLTAIGDEDIAVVRAALKRVDQSLESMR